MKKTTKRHADSNREKQFAEMLKAALARPGVREAMAVYGVWQEKDRGLLPYRSATKEPARVTTTNSSNSQPTARTGPPPTGPA